MKNICILFCFLFFISPLTAQLLTGNQLLNKSIKYHDPNDNWAKFNGELNFEQQSPKKVEQSTREISINRPKNYFKFIQKTGEETIVREVNGKNCTQQYNGSSEIPEEANKKHRFTCERAKMYRDYYTYLYGLPMKLKDPGTIIEQKITETDFQEKPCFSMKVTYEKGVGEDIWYFYFDKNTFALIGYRFYHDQAKNDGEYITLTGEEIIQGIKIPKDRFWYYNKDDQFLGADFLMPEVGGKK